MVYRKVQARIWGDLKFRALDNDTKLLWLYFLTGPHTTDAPGIWHCRLTAIEEDLGLSRDKIKQAVYDLSCRGMCVYDEQVQVLYLPNHLKHNPPKNRNIAKGWLNRLDDLPECELVEIARTKLNNWVTTREQPGKQTFLVSQPEEPPGNKQEQEGNQQELPGNPVTLAEKLLGKKPEQEGNNRVKTGEPQKQKQNQNQKQNQKQEFLPSGSQFLSLTELVNFYLARGWKWPGAEAETRLRRMMPISKDEAEYAYEVTAQKAAKPGFGYFAGVIKACRERVDVLDEGEAEYYAS